MSKTRAVVFERELTTRQFVRWASILGGVGGSQVSVQVLALATGLLIVRMLSQAEYAIYTLAITMLAALTSIAEAGVANGVMAEGAKVWENRENLGAVISTGLELRKYFLYAAVALCAPLLTFLMRLHGVPWIEVGSVVCIVSVNAWLVLLGGVFSVAPALHQDLVSTQRIAILQSLMRLALTGLLLLLINSASAALGATILAAAWSAVAIKRIALRWAVIEGRVDHTARAGILRIVRTVLPVTIYLSFSSQLTIWLASLVGSTTAVAQVGALGRLGQLYSVISAISTAIVVPRFARLRSDAKTIRVRYTQICITSLGLGGLIALCVAAFPNALLMVIGPAYATLVTEVKMQMVCSTIWTTAGIAYALGCARGITVAPAMNIGIQLAWQVLGIFVCSINTLPGLYAYAIGHGLVQLGIFTINYYVKTRSAVNAI